MGGSSSRTTLTLVRHEQDAALRSDHDSGPVARLGVDRRMHDCTQQRPAAPKPVLSHVALEDDAFDGAFDAVILA